MQHITGAYLIAQVKGESVELYRVSEQELLQYVIQGIGLPLDDVVMRTVSLGVKFDGTVTIRADNTPLIGRGPIRVQLTESEQS